MRLKSLSIFSEEDGKEIRNVHFNERGSPSFWIPIPKLGNPATA